MPAGSQTQQVEGRVELDAAYRALREEAGIVDRSDRGLLVVRGDEAAEYLQGQLTNDIEALEPGAGCYAALLDRKGHMQADVRVLKLGEEELWLDSEGPAAPVLLRHLETYGIGRQVGFEDRSSERCVLSVIGPAAGAVTGAGSIGPEHSHRELEAGGARCRAVATDLGIDLIADRADAARIGAALVDTGAPEVEEAAAEVLRVESGRPRLGAEMGPETLPQEAGINDRAVSFTKGCYIGQETVARLHYKGKPNRQLRGLRLSAPARAGDLVRLAERDLGRIGTAVVSPAHGPIALAILRREAQPGDTVAVAEDGIRGTVVDLPFTAADRTPE